MLHIHVIGGARLRGFLGLTRLAIRRFAILGGILAVLAALLAVLRFLLAAFGLIVAILVAFLVVAVGGVVDDVERLQQIAQRRPNFSWFRQSFKPLQQRRGAALDPGPPALRRHPWRPLALQNR